MSYVASIIDQFGGVRAMATALGRAPSTVYGWKDRGTIPDHEKVAVLDAAIRIGLPITKADFWPSRSASEDAA
ncbi:carph-isopro domain-containing protein [Paracoccus denitrificans]|uniref:carph-isopro domain-containing protein n=1 Tax=Paracoccus denitrificans TaxID=266 RepID=UPI003364E8D5